MFSFIGNLFNRNKSLQQIGEPVIEQTPEEPAVKKYRVTLLIVFVGDRHREVYRYYDCTEKEAPNITAFDDFKNWWINESTPWYKFVLEGNNGIGEKELFVVREHIVNLSISNPTVVSW